MMKDRKSNSMSAPKISSNFLPEHNFSKDSNVSQGCSPSLYRIDNGPLFLCSSHTSVFFDDTATMDELHMLGELSPLEPINQTLITHKRKSRSESRDLDSSGSSKKTLRKPQFFDFSKTISEVDEDCSLKSPMSIASFSDFPCIQLQPPPLGRYKKRRERCAFPNEEVLTEIFQGEIKRYNLKKRFGQICYNQQKINVYEDDLILSGVNLKKFKEFVSKKQKILIEFQIKKSLEEGVEKLRPVNIQVCP